MLLLGRRFLKSSSSGVCGCTSGQAIGLSQPAMPEAALRRQRSAAAVPAPGLSLCPTPVSSLLGNKGRRRKVLCA